MAEIFQTRTRIKVNNTKRFFLLIPAKGKSVYYLIKKKKKNDSLINCTFKRISKLKRYFYS